MQTFIFNQFLTKALQVEYINQLENYSKFSQQLKKICQDCQVSSFSFLILSTPFSQNLNQIKVSVKPISQTGHYFLQETLDVCFDSVIICLENPIPSQFLIGIQENFVMIYNTTNSMNWPSSVLRHAIMNDSLLPFVVSLTHFNLNFSLIGLTYKFSSESNRLIYQ